MKLTVLNSNSRGNCYILQNDTEALILEAGVKFTAVKNALDYNISKVAGCLVTHEHGDHSKYVNDYLDACIDVRMSAGTASKIKWKSNRLALLLESKCVKQFGNFRVLPFDVRHDCEEPLGFLIEHPKMGTLLFATDTYYLPYNFPGLNHILIECNYSRDILEENYQADIIPRKVRDRVIASHMSLDTCIEALKANDLSNVRNIILLHLSDKNSNATYFEQEVRAATGRRVMIAEKGLEIELKKELF